MMGDSSRKDLSALGETPTRRKRYDEAYVPTSKKEILALPSTEVQSNSRLDVIRSSKKSPS